MSDQTGIEWTDATWNPVTGCTKVSAGCDNCYAETFAERWRGTPGHYYEHGFDVQLRPNKLDQPLRWRKPRRIFVNSMSDLFHDSVPDDYIARVFAVMALAPWHTFQCLTKRHARMRSLLRSDRFQLQVHAEQYRQRPDGRPSAADWPLPNVWLGVSAEKRQWATIRGDALCETPAAVRFLSCEPLLGPMAGIDLTGIDWVICGGESGRGARPMHSDWVVDLWRQCQAAGVAFHLKQWGEYTSEATLGTSLRGPRPDALVNSLTGEVIRAGQAVHGLGSWQHVWRVGKKRSGRELWGRTWDEYPDTRHGVHA